MRPKSFLLCLLPAVLLLASSASANASSRKVNADTAPPTVSIVRPTAGATIAGRFTVAVKATDDTQVAAVAVKVDQGAYAPAVQRPRFPNIWSAAIDTALYGN